jgi:hypothetical protein
MAGRGKGAPNGAVSVGSGWSRPGGSGDFPDGSTGQAHGTHPSRHPIHHRPVAILKMRFPASLLRDRSHLKKPNPTDLQLTPGNDLIQPILGATPQLHASHRTKWVTDLPAGTRETPRKLWPKPKPSRGSQCHSTGKAGPQPGGDPEGPKPLLPQPGRTRVGRRESTKRHPGRQARTRPCFRGLADLFAFSLRR